MDTQRASLPVEMNWVDYCDSLATKNVAQYAPPQRAAMPAEKLPDPVSIAVERIEAAREIA